MTRGARSHDDDASDRTRDQRPRSRLLRGSVGELPLAARARRRCSGIPSSSCGRSRATTTSCWSRGDGARYSSYFGSRPHIDQRADRSMINMDDPDHQAQRNLVARRFNPGAVRSARRPRARHRHRDPRPGHAARRVRGDRGDRVPTPGDHDQRPARLPPRAVAACAALVGADHAPGRPDLAGRAAARHRSGHPRAHRGLHRRHHRGDRGPPRRATRRPDLAVGPRRGLGRRARARRDPPGARRRRRDDPHRHRHDDPRAGPAARPAPGAPRPT